MCSDGTALLKLFSHLPSTQMLSHHRQIGLQACSERNTARNTTSTYLMPLIIAAALAVEFLDHHRLLQGWLTCKPWMISILPREMFIFIPIQTAANVLLQVLFMLVNLGIPDLLLSGPRSADDLAANIGPHVRPDRLARTLDFAAAFGMINRKKLDSKQHISRKPDTATDGSKGAEDPGFTSAAPQLRVGLLKASSAVAGTPRTTSASLLPLNLGVQILQLHTQLYMWPY